MDERMRRGSNLTRVRLDHALDSRQSVAETQPGFTLSEKFGRTGFKPVWF